MLSADHGGDGASGVLHEASTASATMADLVQEDGPGSGGQVCIPAYCSRLECCCMLLNAAACHKQYTPSLQVASQPAGLQAAGGSITFPAPSLSSTPTPIWAHMPGAMPHPLPAGSYTHSLQQQQVQQHQGLMHAGLQVQGGQGQSDQGLQPQMFADAAGAMPQLPHSQPSLGQSQSHVAVVDPGLPRPVTQGKRSSKRRSHTDKATPAAHMASLSPALHTPPEQQHLNPNTTNATPPTL